MLLNDFSFFLQTNLIFGKGKIKYLVDSISNFGWKKLALVLDAGPEKNVLWQEVEKEISQKHEIVARLVTEVREPTYDYLDQARQSFMGKAIDGFIVMGGGSVMDVGKALSVLVTNTEPAIHYRGFDLIKNPGIPVIAIPTTAGTGSEVTPNAVFIDTKEKRKFGINTTMYIPKLCILDSLLTVSCPRHVTISSGMDALVHAHESFVSKKATPITQLFAKEAFKLVFNAIKNVVNSPQDIDARAQVQLGSYMAAIALFNSSAGPAGAMSYPLGVDYEVPHGLAGAVFLPRIIQHNVNAGYTNYIELYNLIDGALPLENAKAASEAFSNHVWELCDALEVPRTLTSFGFHKKNISQFLEKSQMLQGAFEMNPVSFTVENVSQILEKMT